MLEVGQVEVLLAGLVTGGLAGLVVFVLFRRRIARDIRAAASVLTVAESKSAIDALPNARVFHPLLRAMEERVSGLRSRLNRAVCERDALLTTLSRMGEGVVVTDSGGVVTDVNDVQLSRLQREKQDVAGRPFIEAVQDHEVNDVVLRCLRQKEPAQAAVEATPGKVHLNVVAAPAGPEGGCVVVLQDLTELHRLERVRRDFVANVSHELRTPLASLKLLAETLSEGGADDSRLLLDYLGRIDVEVDRLAQMVDELGQLSVLETGQVSLDIRPLSVSALAAGVAERLRAQAERAGLRLSVEVPEDLPQPSGDARRLEQALVNLVHNAIKFTPAGGTVRIGARKDAEGIAMFVADTGVGIEPQDLERVFERFYKADRSRTSPGTGMGLAIVRHIVQLHGGRIWVESRPRAGATFTFTLPLGDKDVDTAAGLQ